MYRMVLTVAVFAFSWNPAYAVGGVLGGSADEFDSMKILPSKDPSVMRIVYGDNRGFLHVLRQTEEGRFSEEWISRELKSAVGRIFVEDLDLDGRPEIVAYTVGGKIYFFDSEAYTVIWQSVETEFNSISCMVIENVDDDPQKELIFCADSHLYIYDGKNRFEEWASEQEFKAEDIVIADVDGDGAREIVLNTGFVLDAKFHDLEWQSPEPFGDKLGLLDMDNDGILELIGEFSGRFLRVFDVDLRREKF